MTMSNMTVGGRKESTGQAKTEFSRAMAMIREVVGDAHVHTGEEEIERHPINGHVD